MRRRLSPVQAPRCETVCGSGRIALAALLIVAGCSAAPRYAGPRTDHWNGRAFHNLGPFEDPGVEDVFKWKLSGPPAVPWPDFADIPPAPPPPARVTEGIRVTFINHATVLVQMGGVNVLTDPVWSPTIGLTSVLGQKRHKPPGIPFDALPHIDVVLISHNHYDHLDLPTLQRLQARDAPLVIAGLGTARFLRDHDIPHALDLDWWQSHEQGGLRITFAPAQHWSTRIGLDRNRNLWGSYFLAAGDRTVYFAGDTGGGPHFRMVRARLGAPEVALLPIGAYMPRWFMRSQHIDPSEAVAAHILLGARRSVAIHWGTFRQADEGMNDPPADLERARKAWGIAPESFVALENGQGIAIP